jgi:flagellar hook-length control protein FliK
LRASATSRNASPAVFPLPQSKTDASKADDASPFALLLNEVASTTATQQKGTQNKGGQASDEETGNDAASQAAPQVADQAAAKPAKPGKSNGNSTDGQDTATAQQTAAQSQPPAQPPAPQISMLMAAIAGRAAANNAADKDASADPAATADVAANGQNNTQSNPAANAPASQGGSSSQTANSVDGQVSNTGPQVQAQVPVPAADRPQPDATQSALAGPASQPEQAPAAPQNIVQPNPPQPASVPAVPVQPAPIQATGTVLNNVQPDTEKPQATPPKDRQAKTSAAQNSVRPDAAQAPAAQPMGPQTQTPAVQNSVQLDANQPLAANPSGAQVQTPVAQNPVAQNTVQPAAKPAKADKSDGKGTSNGRDKSDGNSAGGASATAIQPAGTQAQTPVQPDASLIASATASAAVTTVADDDTGDGEPGVEAAGTAAVAANGPSKAQAGQTVQSAQAGAQTVKNMLAAQAARQPGATQDPGQGAAPKTSNQTDSAKPQTPGQNQVAAQPDIPQQGTGLFAKPWQAKPQDGTAGTTGDSGQTNTASPDDVKRAAAPVPQTIAADNLPVAKPPEAGIGNMQIMPGAAPQTQQGQGNAAPAVTQNVQIATPSANMPALAVEIAAKSQSGAKQFDIRLDPPELGRVEVRLSIDATGKASAHLSADQPQTLDLLQKDAPALTRALRDAGLNVSQNGLNFSLRQQPGDAGTNNNQSRGGNGRSFTLTATTSLDATSAGAAYRGPANGRLDIRV